MVPTVEDKGKQVVNIEDVQNTTIEQLRIPRTRSVVKKTEMQVKEISQLEQRRVEVFHEQNEFNKLMDK